jgi:hypothetical protein
MVGVERIDYDAGTCEVSITCVEPKGSEIV